MCPLILPHPLKTNGWANECVVEESAQSDKLKAYHLELGVLAIAKAGSVGLKTIDGLYKAKSLMARNDDLSIKKANKPRRLAERR